MRLWRDLVERLMSFGAAAIGEQGSIDRLILGFRKMEEANGRVAFINEGGGLGFLGGFITLEGSVLNCKIQCSQYYLLLIIFYLLLKTMGSSFRDLIFSTWNVISTNEVVCFSELNY